MGKYDYNLVNTRQFKPKLKDYIGMAIYAIIVGLMLAYAIPNTPF